MPNSLPERRTRRPVSIAACAAWPPERSIGIVPAAVKNIRMRKPLMPVPVKYSALATKVTFRRTTSGMKIESENEMWLLAIIAAPRRGTCSSPSATGRKISLSQGPSRTSFISQYSNGILTAGPAGAGRCSEGTKRGHPTQRSGATDAPGYGADMAEYRYACHDATVGFACMAGAGERGGRGEHG